MEVNTPSMHLNVSNCILLQIYILYCKLLLKTADKKHPRKQSNNIISDGWWQVVSVSKVKQTWTEYIQPTT